jgi:hypothetical protein
MQVGMPGQGERELEESEKPQHFGVIWIILVTDLEVQAVLSTCRCIKFVIFLKKSS